MRRVCGRGTPGLEQSFGDRCSILVLWRWTAARESSALVTFLWTVKFAGPLLLDEPVCGETQEEGTSCHSTSARVIHAENSCGCRIWTRRRSASDQQSRDSSSSERHSESHRCERPWSSEELLLQRGGIFNSGRRRRRHSSQV